MRNLDFLPSADFFPLYCVETFGAVDCLKSSHETDTSSSPVVSLLRLHERSERAPKVVLHGEAMSVPHCVIRLYLPDFTNDRGREIIEVGV